MTITIEEERKGITMNTKEMKKILAQKLQDENTYFTVSDISLSKYGENGYKIIIKDYEHIIFFIKLDIDDDFEEEEEICVWMKYRGEKKKYLLFLEESHTDKAIKECLIHLGYYIGTRF